MSSKKFILFLISVAIYFCSTNKVSSCIWVEDWESYRMAMFRAEISGMKSFFPFYYSGYYLNSNKPNALLDWKKNCEEWQKNLGNDVSLEDINFILYQTKPEKFISAYKETRLKNIFDKNSFILKILQPANKDYLDYLVFAKRNEYIHEKIANLWEDNNNNEKFEPKPLRLDLYKEVEITIRVIKNDFLKKRYAFQLVRLQHQLGEYQNCINTYDKYFADNDESILKYWALLHKALCLDNMERRVEANYLYSLVFEKSDEKKIRVYQCFNINTEVLQKTIQLAKNNQEKAAIIALSCFKNPGKILDKIKQIQQLSPYNPFLATLIMREINKMEDWIITPSLSYSYPSIYNTENFNAKEENLKKDLTYLKEFRTFLIQNYSGTTGEMKSYFEIAIAHLFLIDDNLIEGKKYLSLISENAPKSILVQKSIDELLIEINTGDLIKNDTQNSITEQLKKLENLAKNQFELNKTLYTCTKKLAVQYEKMRKVVFPALLFQKAEYYKSLYNQKGNTNYDYCSNLYYWKLAYFDKFAKISDMDEMIALVEKKNKSVFENYICDQKLASIYAYKDLKATIAFRENNLESAYRTFSEIPDTMWTKVYEFKNYLNENPFIPKIWPQNRSFTYYFNKRDFVKQLIDLIKDAEESLPRRAENYLKLGHAYYNCSYWGNSWMMFSYGWSTYPEGSLSSNYTYTFFNDLIERQKKYIDVYFNLDIAISYYKKVLTSTNDKELKAKAQFMLYCCDFNRSSIQSKTNFTTSDFIKSYTSNYVYDFYTIYGNTKAFEELRCPMLDDFAAKMGVNK